MLNGPSNWVSARSSWLKAFQDEFSVAQVAPIPFEESADWKSQAQAQRLLFHW